MSHHPLFSNNAAIEDLFSSCPCEATCQFSIQNQETTKISHSTEDKNQTKGANYDEDTCELYQYGRQDVQSYCPCINRSPTCRVGKMHVIMKQLET